MKELTYEEKMQMISLHEHSIFTIAMTTTNIFLSTDVASCTTQIFSSFATNINWADSLLRFEIHFI